MKKIRFILSGLAAGCIVLAMVSSVAAQTVEQGIAKVVNMQGPARYMVQGSTTWQPVKVGTILKPGSILQTAVNSHVDVVLNNAQARTAATAASVTEVVKYQPKAEQDAIRIFPNTVLAFDKLTVTSTGVETVTETQLNLKAGRIFGTVKKLSPASKYEVLIPNGIAGIRGTIYFISADGMLSVIQGSVVMSYVGPNGDPVTQVVGEGQQFNAQQPNASPSPIAPPDMERFLQAVKELASGRGMPGTSTLARDLTLYLMSPTSGE